MQFYPSLFSILVVVGIYFVFNASAFYITAYYLFPKYLYQQKIARFFLWFIAVSVVLSIGQGLSLNFIFRGVPEVADRMNLWSWIPYSLASILTMVGLLGGAKLVLNKIRADNANKTRDQQRLENELKFLKAQVNPHFLFNSINSVYFLIKKDPDKAAETLIKLSDLLRYQLYDCTDDRIEIEKELNYLRNFIALEKIRKGEKIQVRFDMDQQLSGFQIAPFLLIPFVENAFKHVSNFSSANNRIDIQFEKQNGTFKAFVENTTDNLIKNEVGGIGLKNVKRRLELLYPGKHELHISERDGKYAVQLSLTIT
jgi:LytS/YehU family sensor histidine kinase